MNIWFISKYASPPQFSAAPARLYFIAKEIKEMGHRVTLITSDSNHFSNIPYSRKTYNKAPFDGVDIIWIKTLKYFRTASFRRVLSWLDFEYKLFKMNINEMPKPDVVMASSLSIFSVIYGFYLKKKYKSFLVFEVRDIWPLTMTEEGGFGRWHPLVLLIGWVERFGYKKADLITGTMPRLDIHIHNILGYNKPFLCLPLGFDAHSYLDKIESNENPFKSFVKRNTIIVGYAGSMGITNALDLFVSAIFEMQNDSTVYFLVVGSGDLKDKYEILLRNCKNVIFLPRISQSEVKYFLEICDILYLSTNDSQVWNYGQSMNKIVEYMLAGKPIIASYSGFPSMINEAECGVFVDSKCTEDIKKAILNFATMSKEEREIIGKKGRDWIFKNRRFEKLAGQLIDKIVTMKGYN